MPFSDKLLNDCLSLTLLVGLDALHVVSVARNDLHRLLQTGSIAFSMFPEYEAQLLTKHNSVSLRERLPCLTAPRAPLSQQGGRARPGRSLDVIFTVYRSYF